MASDAGSPVSRSRATPTAPLPAVLFVALLALLAAPAAAQAPAAQPRALKIDEKTIAELSPGAKLESARSTKDHLALVEKNGGRRTVRLDGRPVGGTYDDVNFLRFSGDEQHLAFAAKRGSTWVLVVDGEDRTKPYGKLTAPTLSANGKSLAVGACNGKACRLLVNDAEMEPSFEDISAPAFTSDGAHYVYFGKRDRKWTMQRDGKPYGPPMDDYFTWRMSREADHVAVAALIDKNWAWVVDGRPGPGFDVISDIDVSPDWQHYAYAGTNAKTGMAKSRTTGSLVEDGKVTAQYPGRGFGAGFLGAFAGAYSTIVAGVRRFSADFHGLSDPIYTPEGKLVYAARLGEDAVAVFVAGVPGPSFEDIVSPIGMSEDGAHIGYVVKRGESFVEVRDRRTGAAFTGKRAESFVGILTMSPDGEHLAYEIVRGGSQFQAGRTTRALRRVVIDGRGGAEFDALGIRDLEVTSNGQGHHYTVVGAEGNRDRVVFDGLETRLYDNVFRGSLTFVDEQTIEFVAQDGSRVVRVTAALQ